MPVIVNFKSKLKTLMKNFKLTLVILTIIALSSNCSDLLSQDKKKFEDDGKIVELEMNQEILTSTPDKYGFNAGKINRIGKDIAAARISGNIVEAEKLNKELTELTGDVISVGENIPVSDITYEENSIENDNTTTISLLSTHDMTFNEFETVTEQIGPTAGRIWAIYRWKKFGAQQTDPMYCTFKFSDNGGTLWKHYITFSYISTLIMDGNNMEAEFLYHSTLNRKKLFVTFPTSGGFNSNYVGMLSINADTINPVPVFSAHYWSAVNKTYHSPKMTSDNSVYLTVPYIYICAAEIYDENSFTRQNAIRAARCTNPFAGNPTLTLNMSDYTPIRLGYHTEQFDYAYFRNNSNDSLFLIVRSIDKKALDFYKSQINSSSSASYAGSLSYSGIDFYSPRVASDGNKNIMIAMHFYFTPNDKDVISFYSSGGSKGPYTLSAVSSYFENESDPQITGRYYSNGTFYCSVKKIHENSGSIVYAKHNKNGQQNYYELQNDSLSGYNSYDSKPGFRFVNGDSCFAIWKGNGKLYSSAGCNDSGSYNFSKNLRLRIFMEATYSPVTNVMTKSETVSVYVRNATAPFNIIDSCTSLVDVNGFGYFDFSKINNQVNYYLVVKTKNTIETWSAAGGQKFSNNYLNYDFTISKNRAFGSNQKYLFFNYSVYTIYSGDVNQDGIIDITDAGKIGNDANNFVTGNVATDLNGDGLVDVSDAVFADNNSFNFVGLVRP